MKVRWSSTYSMLDHGRELRAVCLNMLSVLPPLLTNFTVVDTFVFEIAHDERDRKKREKLLALQLTEGGFDYLSKFFMYYSFSLGLESC
jgi:hypothetical protein